MKHLSFFCPFSSVDNGYPLTVGVALGGRGEGGRGEPHPRDWLTINAAQNHHIGPETTTSDWSQVNSWQMCANTNKLLANVCKNKKAHIQFIWNQHNWYASTNTNTQK